MTQTKQAKHTLDLAELILDLDTISALLPPDRKLKLFDQVNRVLEEAYQRGRQDAKAPELKELLEDMSETVCYGSCGAGTCEHEKARRILAEIDGGE
jgi:hypothetical protein